MVKIASRAPNQRGVVKMLEQRLDNKRTAERNLRAQLTAAEADNARLREGVQRIRNIAHAHNRGGEMYRGVRDEIRNMCDAILSATSAGPVERVILADLREALGLVEAMPSGYLPDRVVGLLGRALKALRGAG